MASVVIQLPVADWRMLPHAGFFTLVAINRSSPFQFNITTTRFLHRKTAFADIALPPHGGASSGKWRIQKWLVGAQCNYPHLCLILLADRTKAKCIIDTNIKLYKISVLGTFVLANIALDHTKAVTRDIFRGGGGSQIIPPFSSFPFPSLSSFHFPSLSTAAKWRPESSSGIWESTVSFPTNEGRENGKHLQPPDTFPGLLTRDKMHLRQTLWGKRIFWCI